MHQGNIRKVLISALHPVLHHSINLYVKDKLQLMSEDKDGKACRAPQETHTHTHTHTLTAILIRTLLPFTVYSLN